MLVRVAKLVPIGIMSPPFGMTGILELGQPEPPSTTGTSDWLEMPCLSGWPELMNLMLGVVLLALLSNMSDRHYKLTIRNGRNARYDTAGVAAMAHVELPGRSTPPGRCQISGTVLHCWIIQTGF